VVEHCRKGAAYPIGIANAVGLAIGQAHMGATFNKDGFPLVDNHTFGRFDWIRKITA